jgi:hypothetical protein
MPQERPSARIAFGVIRSVSVGGDEVEALEESLVPGTYVERYGRVWRMGRWRREDDAIFGRIGFEEEPGVTELWNEDKNDFEEQALPSGVTSPFVIRTADSSVASKERASTHVEERERREEHDSRDRPPDRALQGSTASTAGASHRRLRPRGAERCLVHDPGAELRQLSRLVNSGKCVPLGAARSGAHDRPGRQQGKAPRPDSCRCYETERGRTPILRPK